MESVQKDLLSVLLSDIFNRGLISRAAYLKGEDLLYSAAEFPDFFAFPTTPTAASDSRDQPRNS